MLIVSDNYALLLPMRRPIRQHLQQ